MTDAKSDTRSGAAPFLWRLLVRPLPPGLVRAGARLLFSRSFRAFDRAAADPGAAQQERLRQILSRNRDTAFGREHGFAGIRTVGEFQSRVPIRGYDEFAPWIERTLRGEAGVLTEEPVTFFGRTSGTTGAAKFIPVTASFVEEYRRGRRVWARQVAQAFPGLVRGSLLTVHSPRIEGHTESGVPFGSITIAIGGSDASATGRGRLFAGLESIPRDIFFVPDFDSRYYLLLRLAVGMPVSLMAAVNPSTLLLLCRKLTEFGPALVRECHDGTLRDGIDLSRDLLQKVRSHLRPRPEVAARIERSLAAHGRVRPIDVWSELCGLLCWTGGAAPFFLRQFPEWFGDLPVMDYGYAATEGNFSIVLEPGAAGGVVSLLGHFLEFVPESERESRSPVALAADELESGRRYYVLVTAGNGLYRYDMNDVVEVIGRYRKTPVIRFCHKGQNVASITGEKLSESQVIEAVNRAQADASVPLLGFCALVHLSQEIPRYLIAVEPSGPQSEDALRALCRACDQRLQEANIEYRAKRESTRLGPALLALVRPGAFDRLRQQRVAAGAPDAHVKLPHLSSDPTLAQRIEIERTLGGDGA
jgi:hypothetical protein